MGPCSHEGVAPARAGLRGRPGGGSTGRDTRGARGSAAEGAGIRPESHGRGQDRPEHGAGVGGGSAGQALAGRQRRPGEAAAGLAEGAAGRALEAAGGCIAPPGVGRGPPSPPPAVAVLAIKRR